MVRAKEIMGDENPSIEKRFASLAKFAKSKPSTPKELKKANPAAMFLEQLDAQLDAFNSGKDIRGSWVKKTAADLYFITFGKPPIEFHDTKGYEATTQEEVNEIFNVIREAVSDESGAARQKVFEAAVKPKPERKPRKAK